MTRVTVYEYAAALGDRYRMCRKKEKGRILDESRLPAGRSARPQACIGKRRSGFSAGVSGWLRRRRRRGDPVATARK